MTGSQLRIGAQRRELGMRTRRLPLLAKEQKRVAPLARRRMTADALQQRIERRREVHAGSRQYARA